MPSSVRKKEAEEEGKDSKDDDSIMKVSKFGANLSSLSGLDPRATRIKKIREHVKFEHVKCDMLELSRLEPYELHLRRMRGGIIKNGFCCRTDDLSTQEVQTDAIETDAISMQFPEDIGLDVAGGKGAVGSGPAFTKFLQRASHVCEMLLGENACLAQSKTITDSRGVGGGDSKGASEGKQEEEEDYSSMASGALTLPESISGGVRDAVTALGYRTTRMQQLRKVDSLSDGSAAKEPVEAKEEKGGEEEEQAKQRAEAEAEAREDSNRVVAQVLSGRQLVAMHFSQAMPNLLLTAYTSKRVGGGKAGRAKGKEEAKDGDGAADTDAEWALLESKAVLAVWDVNQPLLPVKLLVMQGEPVCCAMEVLRPHICFAGSSEGSVLVWDLRESNSMHLTQPMVDHKLGVALRSPTYSTDIQPDAYPAAAAGGGIGASGALLVGTSQHCSAVIKVMPQPSSSASSSSSSFPMATLDDRGTLSMWTVVEGGANESSASSDLSASIGGRVRLIKSAALNLDIVGMGIGASVTGTTHKTTGSPLKVKKSAGGPQPGKRANTSMAQKSGVGEACTAIEFFPNDANQFVFARADGSVYRGCRYGALPSPHMFLHSESAAEDDAAKGETKGDGGDEGAGHLAALSASAVSEGCIAFNSFDGLQDYFLVGRRNGDVRYVSSAAHAPCYISRRLSPACIAPPLRTPSTLGIAIPCWTARRAATTASSKCPSHRCFGRQSGLACFLYFSAPNLAPVPYLRALYWRTLPYCGASNALSLYRLFRYLAIRV
jgi:hypothetical protein